MSKWDIKRKPTEAQLKYWESLKGVKNEKAPNWKGNSGRKSNVHKWLDVNYGKPNFCEGCGTQEDRIYDWANISGKYLRDREDFLRFCRTCHRRFDLTSEKRKQAIKNLWWKKNQTNPGIQFENGHKYNSHEK